MELVRTIVSVIAAADEGGGLTQQLQDANIPALVLLGTSGVAGVFIIVRWMVKYQQEFTNFYVEENNKLRSRIDQLEAEVVDKDEKYMQTRRDMMSYEIHTQRQIRELENTIGSHERTITRHEETIADLMRRLGDGG